VAFGRNRDGGCALRNCQTLSGDGHWSSPMDAQPGEIIDFWADAGNAKWFGKDDAFDQAIRTRFLAAHESAARGELMRWDASSDGALALILLLDQFPRNLFRNSAHAFATDQLGLSVARTALARGQDLHCRAGLKPFFYIPFMHSEAIADQELCVSLCRTHGLAANIEFAETHRDIIARFGRFPHRNAVFGRTTTPEEQAFLQAGGFAG
jgi:uncharacterized protein (DUF924 family)